MDDQKIIRLLYARSEQAVDALSKKYGPLFRQIAVDILGSGRDAEEAVNDLYLALWDNIPPERPENLKAYAVRVLRNISVKRYHSNAAQKRNSHYDVALEEIAEFLPGADTPEEILDAKELTRLLDAFLDGLSARDRVFFLRRYYMAETPAQIGREMGYSAQYISLRLHRVRKHLKDYLMREGIVV